MYKIINVTTYKYQLNGVRKEHCSSVVYTVVKWINS